jgi:hypothetical protein
MEMRSAKKVQMPATRMARSQADETNGVQYLFPTILMCVEITAGLKKAPQTLGDASNDMSFIEVRLRGRD